MKNILCYFGIHKWEYIMPGIYSHSGLKITCKRCGKINEKKNYKS